MQNRQFFLTYKKPKDRNVEESIKLHNSSHASYYPFWVASTTMIGASVKFTNDKYLFKKKKGRTL